MPVHPLPTRVAPERVSINPARNRVPVAHEVRYDLRLPVRCPSTSEARPVCRNCRRNDRRGARRNRRRNDRRGARRNRRRNDRRGARRATPRAAGLATISANSAVSLTNCEIARGAESSGRRFPPPSCTECRRAGKSSPDELRQGSRRGAISDSLSTYTSLPTYAWRLRFDGPPSRQPIVHRTPDSLGPGCRGCGSPGVWRGCDGAGWTIHAD